MSASNPISVSQLNRYVKSLLEGEAVLQSVYLRGEISNFTNHYKSGHLYFSLKDENAAIRAVMFSSAARRLRFAPRDGMQIIARGRVSLYEQTGSYQFYAEDMMPDGLGALHLAFEQLRDKLQKEGLFDPARKKPIPRYPKTIAVITSETGAAVRDILEISARRWPLASILLRPVLVQGEGAAPDLAKALGEVNRDGKADVIIIGRGGGSLEDLFAFNEEIVARAVAASEIPVISAVGHETDFTICDFAADLRAPTPSAAAELAVPDRNEELARLRDLSDTLSRLLTGRIRQDETMLARLRASHSLAHPAELIRDREMQVDRISGRLAQIAAARVSSQADRLAFLSGKMDALSPLKVLSRGYAIAEKADTVVKSASVLSKGETLRLRFSDGGADCEVKELFLEEL